MTQDIIANKFSILFDWFDSNRNGSIGRADFEHGADVFSSVVPADDQKNRSAIRAAFIRWWELIESAKAADAGKQISRSQFVAAMRSHVTHPDHFDNIVPPIADALLDSADTDGSGTLSIDEYLRIWEGLGVSRKEATEAFRKLDSDNNGFISHEEYRVAVSEFCLSADPESTGNHMMGGSPLAPA